MFYYLHATGVHSTTNQAHPSLSLLYLSRQIYKVILFTCAHIEFYSEKELQLKASPKTPQSSSALEISGKINSGKLSRSGEASHRPGDDTEASSAVVNEGANQLHGSW
ncbi:hypothetical protein AMECASPLE_010811, partial [Ameca splendens]